MKPGRRSGGRACDRQQPGLPEGEARLLAVREADGAVLLSLDTGVTYEVAPGSLPAGLPPAGEVLDEGLHRAVALAAARKAAARDLMATLDRRLDSVRNLRRRLMDRGHPDEAVDAVLQLMEERGLHSDRRYAEAYCRDRLLSKPVGSLYLAAKLREKGVDDAVARQVAGDAVAEHGEDELALAAARAKWRRLRRTDDPRRDLAKVVRHLAGRGFAAGTANRAARAADDEDER